MHPKDGERLQAPYLVVRDREGCRAKEKAPAIRVLFYSHWYSSVFEGLRRSPKCCSRSINLNLCFRETAPFSDLRLRTEAASVSCSARGPRPARRCAIRASAISSSRFTFCLAVLLVSPKGDKVFIVRSRFLWRWVCRTRRGSLRC